MRTHYPTTEEVIERCHSVFHPIVIDTAPATLNSHQVCLQPLVDRGFFVQRIDQRPVTNERELFDAIAESCGFPSYFGRNWNALQDSLLDFSWLAWKPKGFALVFRHPEELDWASLSMLIVVVSNVEESLAPKGIPFKMLFPARSRKSSK